MSLSSQTKNVCGFFDYPFNISIDEMNEIDKKLESFLKSHSTEYYFIRHDLDVNPTGELKTIHTHFAFKDNNNLKRISTHINVLSQALGIETTLITARVWKDYEGFIQYLIHKNDKDKYPYDKNLIHTNMSSETLDLILSRPLNPNLTIEFIADLVRKYRGSILDIYRELGIANVKLYRSIIIDLVNLYNNRE